VLSVVTWLWRDPGYRSTFTPAHVHTLYAMVARHYPQPFEKVCVTDDPAGLDPDIRIVPLWPDYRGLPSPHGRGNPGCYERLKAFDPATAAQFGARFVSLDLDTVIVGDLTPLWDRPDPFVVWHLRMGHRTNGHKGIYNGSMWLMDAGARPDVWTRFKGRRSALEAYRAGQHGSDQGWMQYVLGADVPHWDQADGVYSYKYDLLAHHHGHLPANARVVFFHGKPDPWDRELEPTAWVREAYC
jgi:hypothetical protein